MSGPEDVADPIETSDAEEESVTVTHDSDEPKLENAAAFDGATVADPDSLDIPDHEALADPPSGDEEDPGAAALEGLRSSAPVVTGARPSRVDKRGGTPVTLLGAGFGPGCAVYVGGEELIAEVVDGFTLRFVAPGGEGKGKVEVRTAGGNASTGEVELEFAAGPTIRGATPAEGPLEGGIEVALDGDGFAPGCAVSLFGTHAPDLIFDSEKRLRFVLPAAADGPLEGALAVTNPDGLSDRSESVFRYKPLHPKLESIEPSFGWISGGKILLARGVDFHHKARAFLGELPASVVFKSRELLEIEVPESEVVGVVDVTIENPDGKRATSTGAFTYQPVPAPPKIIDVFPREVTTLGKVSVRIHGDNFTDDVRVTVGDVTSVRKVVSSKLIDVEIPPRVAPGPVAIAISLEGVTIREEDALTYVSPAAPKITHLEPRSGPTGGGTKIVIEGEGFPPNAAVLFDGFLAKTVVVKNANRIETVAPPSKRAALVDVEVTSPETGGGIAKAGFKYEATAPPTITSVSPNRGTIDGGTELGVEGKNFGEGCVVLVGGVVAKTRRVSGSLLEANTPEGDDGKLVDVVVRNPDGQQAIQKRAFQYDARYRA